MREKFEKLVRPSVTNGVPTFSVSQLTASPLSFLGRSSENHAAFLVESDHPALTPIDLRHLRLYFAPKCRVELDGSEKTLGMTVLECQSSDIDLQTYFVDIMGLVLERSGGENPGILHALALLVELFREVTSPPRSSVVGLWGELLVIAESSEIPRLIDAWHVDPDDRFDFSEGNVRLEVKTTTGEARRHFFSHEQLRPHGHRVFVASVMTRQSHAGISIADLQLQIVHSLQGKADLYDKLMRVVAQTLGRDWRQGISETFDVLAGRTSLRLFNATWIPALEDPIPAEVTNVTYQVDLSEVETASPADIGQSEIQSLVMA